MQIPALQIVEVCLEDLQILKHLSKTTFYATFGELNSPENMQLYDDTHFTDEQLRSELRNPDSKFFFAKIDEEILGYLKLNQGDAQTFLPNKGGMEIERIYVDQQLKGKGIGKAFIAHAIRLAKEIRANYVWLGVWEHNIRAIRFYESQGFLTLGQHIFKLGDCLLYTSPSPRD